MMEQAERRELLEGIASSMRNYVEGKLSPIINRLDSLASAIEGHKRGSSKDVANFIDAATGIIGREVANLKREAARSSAVHTVERVKDDEPASYHTRTIEPKPRVRVPAGWEYVP